MKISIITAVYNRENTVGQTMRSVQAQNYADIEHVIQDGGSTDDTLGIVKGLADDRTNIISAPDEGIYDAINKGISTATGDVIGLLHSDDFLSSKSVIAKVADALADPRIDGVFGDLDYVAAEDTDRVIRHWKSGAFSQEKLRRGWMPPHPTVYLRRDVFERFGLYDTTYQIAADYDAMLRYLGTGGVRLGYIPEVLVKMRVGGVSNRSLWHIMQKTREDYRALRTNGIGGIGALSWKNISKVSQFVIKGKNKP